MYIAIFAWGKEILIFFKAALNISKCRKRTWLRFILYGMMGLEDEFLNFSNMMVLTLSNFMK